MPPKNAILRRPTTRSRKQLLVAEKPTNTEVVEMSPTPNTPSPPPNTPSPNLQQSQSASVATINDDDTTINEGNDESPIQGSDNSSKYTLFYFTSLYHLLESYIY